MKISKEELLDLLILIFIYIKLIERLINVLDKLMDVLDKII